MFLSSPYSVMRSEAVDLEGMILWILGLTRKICLLACVILLLFTFLFSASKNPWPVGSGAYFPNSRELIVATDLDRYIVLKTTITMHAQVILSKIADSLLVSQKSAK